MAYFDSLYEKNFIEYASYVIKDRAIPHLDDGLKPVQRRILHSLFEMDDGKFHKVANVVGHSMKYHPHGDASIFSALVVVANKEMFIDKQGNFGNMYTGDSASAARYIECRVTPMAKEILYNPELTKFNDSYDGRNKEPETFPAKIPVLLAHGTEGIAVGMATKILPHNLIELIQAQIAYLKNREFMIFPDFLTCGFVDVSEYDDGNGKVLVRAKLDTKHPSKIIIREIPFGATTESLIASIENAAKKNKIKISSIADYTAENVEIEIKLARGVHSEETEDALFAFTDCEMSISVNLLVVSEQKPKIMTVTDVIKHNTDRLQVILRKELEIEQGHLNDRLHAKTLEQVFIENRIYKGIEDKDSGKKVREAVFLGLKPFSSTIKRDVTAEDVETLLKIPIRRISLYDINKAGKEMREIKKRLKEIKESLNDIISYSINFLEELVLKYKDKYPRQTVITSFKKIDIREAARRDIKFCYDKVSGYIGTKVNSDSVLIVSPYDRVLIIRKTGDYSVVEVPEKLFIDKGVWHVGFVEKEIIYNLIYKEKKTGYVFIKRFHIEKFILNKIYNLIPKDCSIIDLTINQQLNVKLIYKPKPRLRSLEGLFKSTDYSVRGSKAGGIRLAKKEIKSARFTTELIPENEPESENNDKPKNQIEFDWKK